MLVGMDPLIKQSHFYIDRDAELENRVFDELITSKGITDYLFVHEIPYGNNPNFRGLNFNWKYKFKKIRSRNSMEN